MKTAACPSNGCELPPLSRTLMNLFALYSRGYLGRHFHSMRIAKNGMPPYIGARPLVVYLNHAAWWDPLVCLMLAREFFPERRSFAPIDAAMLARYAFFRRLGFFGIEPGTRQGARTFLRMAETILHSSSRALWLTPQGRFADVRERPAKLQKGLGALAAREPGAAFVPLAVEYSFWTEPQPEILVCFGAPVVPLETRSSACWTRLFAAELQAAQDQLEVLSRRRDPADWLVLNRGRAGVGTVYDTWRRLRARVSGTRFAAEHSGGVG